MNDEMYAKLDGLKEARPFERFAFLLKDGRHVPVERRLQFGFNHKEIIVIDDDDRIIHFKYDQIDKVEMLTPAT